MAWLVAVDEELAGRRFSLDAPCLVGRGPYNHVVLDDTRISRQHAKISPEPGGHVVYDLNSANGTFVNEVQVKRQKLAPGDVVRFGPFTFRFESEVLDNTGPIKVAKFREVHTQVGSDPPSQIIDSLERRAGRVARARRRAWARRLQPGRSRSLDGAGVAGGDGAAERAHARRVVEAAAAAAGSAAGRADPEVVPTAAIAVGGGDRV